MKLKHRTTVVFDQEGSTGNEVPEYPKAAVNASAAFLSVGDRVVIVQHWIELTERELLEAQMQTQMNRRPQQ